MGIIFVTYEAYTIEIILWGYFFHIKHHRMIVFSSTNKECVKKKHEGVQVTPLTVVNDLEPLP